MKKISLRKEEEFKKIVNLLENCYGSASIYFHCDADGVCSAAQLYRYFLLRGMRCLLAAGELEEGTFKKIGKSVDIACIVDLPVDHSPSLLSHVRADSVVVVDHHPPKRNLNSFGILHLNPRFYEKNAYISASELVFEICSALGMRDVSWIKRIGAAGDRSIRGTKKEMLAVEYIDAVKAIKGENALNEVVEKLATCKNLEQFLSVKKFETLAKKFKKEVEKFVLEGEKMARERDVVILEMDTRYSIISRVANEIFDRFPDKTVVVYSCKNGIFKISGRSRKINMGRVFSECAKNVGKGGGHEVAAGARIDGDKIEVFLKRLKKFLKNIK